MSVNCISFGETHKFHSAGIGYATSCELVRNGCKVYLACRNEAKALTAIESMRSEIRNVKEEQLVWLPLDLMDLESVVQAAKSFMRQENRLDILGL